MSKRFHFDRKEDASGISGTGRVADGVLFDNGLIALTWNSVHKCVNIYTSLAEMMAVHGHEGRTTIVWVDGDPDALPLEPLVAEEADEKPTPKRKRAVKKTAK